MATIAAEIPAQKKDKRPSTAHLKIVPEAREMRDQVRAAAAKLGKTLDRSKPLTKPVLQEMAEELLAQLGLGEQYLGFTMVAISNEFWRETGSGHSLQSPVVAVAALLEKR